MCVRIFYAVQHRFLVVALAESRFFSYGQKVKIEMLNRDILFEVTKDHE